jgi:hypothetical protein
MPLNATPISRNLRTSVRMLGLDIEDLLALGVIAVFALIIGQFIFPHDMVVLGLPMNWFCFLVVVMVGVPGLMIFKYGKPRGYLRDFLAWHLKPHTYSALARDREITGPYIIEDNDELPKHPKGANPHA